MDAIEAIMSRRSIRRFTHESIPDETIEARAKCLVSFDHADVVKRRVVARLERADRHERAPPTERVTPQPDDHRRDGASGEPCADDQADGRR